MAATATQTAFAPTRWSLVLAAQGDAPSARVALGELCEAYWPAVIRFLRREGRDADAAQELAQEFFARVLAGPGFAGADPARGRFRSFLLGALKHFLADTRKHDRRLKRAAERVPFHAPDDATAAAAEPVAPADAGDAFFDRAWALAVMDRALAALAAEAAAAGRAEHFATLKPWLAGGAADLTQAAAAAQLGMGEGAVKVAIHRLRRRFRQWVRAEVAQTLGPGDHVDEELRYLVDVLAKAQQRAGESGSDL
ncbi:MAG: sigma-70 family RNA polymerase sigma factor [Verrucomicrobiae bacterium]|nr:sigma-70 family RNA polymerase sigma factor [Verrucomicrobiae bacterium]